jgi:hypothetical protein
MDWQQVIVFLIVAAAAVYLWRRNTASRGGSGCGGCGKCAATPQAAAKPTPELIQLDLGPRRPSPKS